MMTREEAIELLCYGDWLNVISEHIGKQDTERIAKAMCIVGKAFRPVSREQVERIRGTWEPFGGKYLTRKKCSRCGWDGQEHIKFYSWCPNCGSPMTDEAVDMILGRWKEALGDET